MAKPSLTSNAMFPKTFCLADPFGLEKLPRNVISLVTSVECPDDSIQNYKFVSQNWFLDS